MDFSPSPQGRPMRGRVHSGGGGGYRNDRGGGQGRYRDEMDHKRRPRREFVDEGQEYWPPLSPRSPRSPPSPRGHHRRSEPEFGGRGGRRMARGRRRGDQDFYEGDGGRGYDEFRSSHRGNKGRRQSFADEEHHHYYQGRRSGGGKEDYYSKESHEYTSFPKGYDYHRGGHDRDSLKYHKESLLSPKEDWDYRDRSPHSPRDLRPLHLSHKSPSHRSHRHYYKTVYSSDDLVLHRKPARSRSSSLSSASRSRSLSPSLRGSRSRSVSRSPSLRGSFDREYSDRSRSLSRSGSRSSYSDYSSRPPPQDDNFRSPLGSDYEPVDTYQTEDTYDSRHYPGDERRVKYSPRSGSSGRSSYDGEASGPPKSSGLREIKYSSKGDRLVEMGSKDLHYEKLRDVSRREKKRRYSFSPVAVEHHREVSPPSGRRRTSTRKKRIAAPVSAHKSRSRSPL